MRSLDCPRCEELAEEVAYLRGELGLHADEEALCALSRAFRLSPQGARVLMMLYRGRGRVVPSYHLQDTLAGEETQARQLIAQYVHKIRASSLGKSAVLTDWYKGYRLSSEAIARIDQILSTQGGGGSKEQYDRQTNGAKPRADLQAGRASGVGVSGEEGAL